MKSREAGLTLIELLVSITLFSLLAVAVLFGLRIGINAMERSKDRFTSNRRVLGVERVLTQQIAGFIPVKADCMTGDGPLQRVPFFQGEPNAMRFVSTYSLNEASRGYPRILEFTVVPGDKGEGVRLVVNEFVYTGPLSAGMSCVGVVPGPVGPQIIFKPVQISNASFVLADRLASCQFAFKLHRELPQPDVWLPRWPGAQQFPNAIRVDLVPLSADPARLEIPSIVASVHVNRDPLVQYVDIEPYHPSRRR
jgi:general secretion pathway protein J